jgi:hypothetical protein
MKFTCALSPSDPAHCGEASHFVLPLYAAVCSKHTSAFEKDGAFSKKGKFTIVPITPDTIREYMAHRVVDS